MSAQQVVRYARHGASNHTARCRRSRSSPPPPPHTHTDWGKNWDRTFTNPSCPILSKHPAGFKAMAALQDK